MSADSEPEMHPLVRDVLRLAVPGEEEPYAFDAEAQKAMEQLILSHKEDPTLPAALLALLQLATSLHGDLGAPTAGYVLSLTLGKLAPRLPVVEGLRRREAEARAERFNQFSGQRTRFAEGVTGPAPKLKSTMPRVLPRSWRA